MSLPNRVASWSGQQSALAVPSLLRELNERIVLEALRERGSRLRADLARITGLSKPTYLDVAEESTSAFGDRGFETVYGHALVADLVGGLGSYVLVAQPEPWAFVEPVLPTPPRALVWASELTRPHLEAVAAQLPECDAIVGIGGGSAMDTAKWLHGRCGLPLYQVPSLPSVDACFTRMTALRDHGGVVYEGDAVPERVVVDFDLMWSAPRHLVAGGIGDVLSCHTAVFDWRLAVDRGVEDHPWDESAAAMSALYLAELETLAPMLVAGDDDGLRRLMECHRDIGWLCHDLGHARFEEGSEHFFAYAFEAVNGWAPMHGELVAVGVLVMSAMQGNDEARARDIVMASGMRHRPDDIGMSWDAIDATLDALPQFVGEQSLWYSFANELPTPQVRHRTARLALSW